MAGLPQQSEGGRLGKSESGTMDGTGNTGINGGKQFNMNNITLNS